MKLYELVGRDKNASFSPFVWRVKLALEHKGLSYETIPLHFTEIKDALSFANASTVPVLVDGKNVISDSWEIVCYLEEAYPGRRGIFSDHHAAKLFNFQMGMPLLAPLFRTIVSDIYLVIHDMDKDYFRNSREARIGCTLEEAAKDYGQSLSIFKANLVPYSQFFKREQYIGGASPSYQDYALYAMFLWARATSDKKLLEDNDPLTAWIVRMDKACNGIGGKVKKIE